jgi:hypothetical protein
LNFRVDKNAGFFIIEVIWISLLRIETMKTWWAILIGVIGGLLGAGLLLLMNSNPRGEVVTLAPPPTPLPLVVDVSGAVNAPGVYELTSGSRVEDAIAAAGGLTEDAQADNMNLAAPLADGL